MLAPSGLAGGGEAAVVGEVDDRVAGVAVGGDEPGRQPGRDRPIGVGVGAGGAPHGDRHRRFAGHLVDEGWVESG